MWKIKFLAIVLPACFVAASVSLVKDELHERKLDREFLTQSEVAPLTVRNYNEKTLTRGSGDKERYIGTLHHADLSYSTQSGEHINLPQHLLTSELAEKCARRESIDIRYLIDSPQTFRLADHPRKPLSLVGVVMMGVVSLAVLAVFLRRLMR